MTGPFSNMGKTVRQARVWIQFFHLQAVWPAYTNSGRCLPYFFLMRLIMHIITQGGCEDPDWLSPWLTLECSLFLWLVSLDPGCKICGSIQFTFLGSLASPSGTDPAVPSEVNTDSKVYSPGSQLPWQTAAAGIEKACSRAMEPGRAVSKISGRQGMPRGCLSFLFGNT